MKHQVQINLGEEAQHIPFLNTAADVMDAGAKATQDIARIADIPVVDAVAGSSGDFDGLANALGVEKFALEVAQQAGVPQQFDIAEPRKPKGRPRSTPYTWEPAVRPDKTRQRKQHLDALTQV